MPYAATACHFHAPPSFFITDTPYLMLLFDAAAFATLLPFDAADYAAIFDACRCCCFFFRCYFAAP